MDKNFRAGGDLAVEIAQEVIRLSSASSDPVKLWDGFFLCITGMMARAIGFDAAAAVLRSALITNERFRQQHSDQPKH